MSNQQKPPAHAEGNIIISGGGTIKGQGFAVGPGATVNNTGNVYQGGETTIDLGSLKSSLAEIYEILGASSLPLKQKMALQLATGRAAELAEEKEPKPEALAEQIRQMGETFQSAGETIDAGSQLGRKILKIANIVGPLVAGGARLVAGWFGLPLL